MLQWTKDLIHFRRCSPSLNDGELSHIKVKFDEEKRWLLMTRGDVRLVCNLGKELHRCPKPDDLVLVMKSARRRQDGRRRRAPAARQRGDPFE